jgi:dTDP-4-dehydrorhamnose reductase
MKILIIGASGLVGGNCLQHFQKCKPFEAIGTYYSYKTADTTFFDTLNPGNPANFDVESFRPDVIVHCGALTHVDYCETHEAESYEKTVVAFRNTLNLAKKLNAKIVYISTDYVFDGVSGPYEEDAVQNPLSVYARHKAEAEELARSYSNHLVLRITNVYGNEERNKNFVSRIIEQAADGKHLNLTLPYDQYATPVNAYDIARALELLLIDNKSGVYHIASTDFLNRVELALRLLKYFPNATYDLKAISTKELNQPAARPLIGGLITRKFSSEYPEFLFTNVDDFVRTKIKTQNQ